MSAMRQPAVDRQRLAREELVSEGLLSTTQAAQFLGVSLRHLWRLMDAGEVPFTRIGRARYIPKRALVSLAADGLVWRGWVR